MKYNLLLRVLIILIIEKGVRGRNSWIWENGERGSYSNCSIFNGTRVEVINIAMGADNLEL
jgi:hypothetical protein